MCMEDCVVFYDYVLVGEVYVVIKKKKKKKDVED